MRLTMLVSAWTHTVIKTHTCPCSSPFISMSTQAMTHFASFYADKGMSKWHTHTQHTHFFHSLGHIQRAALHNLIHTNTHTHTRQAEPSTAGVLISAMKVMSYPAFRTTHLHVHVSILTISYRTPFPLFQFFHLSGVDSLHVSSQGALSDLPPCQRQLHDPARCFL